LLAVGVFCENINVEIIQASRRMNFSQSSSLTCLCTCACASAVCERGSVRACMSEGRESVCARVSMLVVLVDTKCLLWGRQICDLYMCMSVSVDVDVRFCVCISVCVCDCFCVCICIHVDTYVCFATYIYVHVFKCHNNRCLENVQPYRGSAKGMEWSSEP